MCVIVRNLPDLPTEQGNCGIRRRLITHNDCDILSLSHLSIQDARPHYHRLSHEIYYVLDGEGLLRVNEKDIPLTTGAAVLIPPFHFHQAIAFGRLDVLVIMSPSAAELDDIFYE